MSVKLRLKRMGSKKRPFYRIVATDSRNARDGRFIETLGYYNPIVDPPDINVKEELIFKWMERGAIPSDQTRSLLKRTGTMKKWSLIKQGVSMEDLETRVEQLKAKETPALTAEERKSKVDAKKAAEEKKAAEAVAAETAEAEKAAAEAAQAKETAAAEAAQAKETAAAEAAQAKETAAAEAAQAKETAAAEAAEAEPAEAAEAPQTEAPAAEAPAAEEAAPEATEAVDPEKKSDE